MIWWFLGGMVIGFILALEIMRSEHEQAVRYRWLKRTDETTLCAIAWRFRAACGLDTADECIDAARKAEFSGEKYQKRTPG